MHSEGQITLNLLHDMALLYLGLAHGTDRDLDPAETRAISAKLRVWQPHRDPALIDHVIREATLTYLNGASRERLREAVLVLKESLPDTVLQQMLKDLSDIARADGEIMHEERRFIEHIAKSWDIVL